MNTQGKFDWITDPTKPRPLTEWDVEIAGSRYFSVIPSLGSLVPGWLLVVPRRATLNLRDLSNNERRDLDRLCVLLREELAVFPGTIFEFEHGSLYRGSVMGCGVDQAHLHVVPLPFDLIKAAKKADEQRIAWLESGGPSEPWAHIPDGSEYILIREAERRSLVGVMLAPESQWVRKIVAENLFPGAEWNYKKNSGVHHIRATLRAFGAGRDSQAA